MDVTNDAGTVRSSTAELKVILPPTIFSQIEPYTGKEGDQFILRVGAAGRTAFILLV